MRAITWSGLAALVLVSMCATVGRSASAAPSDAAGAWVEYLSAAGDSVRYAAHWSPPAVGPDQRPIAGYDVEIVLGGQTILASAQTVQVADTLTIARPAPGDSLGPLTLRVRSRDVGGAVSAWAVTAPWTLHHDALPPSPPVQVRVDSGAVALDSVILRPRVVAMEPGAHVQMCPILFPSRGVPGLPLEYTAKPECLSAYDAWVAEHVITA